MNTNQLNQQVEQSKQNCQDNTITVDCFTGQSKGYCKAKDLQNQSPDSLLNTPSKKNIDHFVSKLSGHNLFKQLGVDYVG